MFSGITSMLQELRMDPGGTIITLLYLAICLLFSLIIHECAHGYAALKCGDSTAWWLGRLTLDPRKHLDPLGTICMIFLRVGWATRAGQSPQFPSLQKGLHHCFPGRYCDESADLYPEPDYFSYSCKIHLGERDCFTNG